MNVVVIGASSAMAQEAARCFAATGASFLLVGRDAQKLADVAEDLKARGAKDVRVATADLADVGRAGIVLGAIRGAFDKVDVALVAHGSLGVQQEAEKSYAVAEEILRVNFLSYVALLTELANLFEAQRSGVIAAISSVAGDRGRQSNYVYGAAKAGLTAFLAGMRNRLVKCGVHVVTIKPGFVATPMTAHLPQGPLFVSAAKAGSCIHQAILKKRDVAYVPFFWMFIMMVIKSIPEMVFKKLKL